MHRLITEVKAAQEEANENATLLKPMRKLFEKLRDLDDFAVIPTLFRPILHLLLLVWTHGRHYNTATRFVTLMRLICNEVLQQARRFAPGTPLSTEPRSSFTLNLNLGTLTLQGLHRLQHQRLGRCQAVWALWHPPALLAVNRTSMADAACIGASCTCWQGQSEVDVVLVCRPRAAADGACGRTGQAAPDEQAAGDLQGPVRGLRQEVSAAGLWIRHPPVHRSCVVMDPSMHAPAALLC